MASEDVALRELVFADVEARLSAIDGVQEVDREPSSAPAAFNALHIFDHGQKPDGSDAWAARYDMAFVVQGYVEMPGGSAAHTELNRLYVATVRALMTEPPLGGLVETIDEGSMQVQVANLASERRLSFLLDFYVSFPTRRGDPAQPA